MSNPYDPPPSETYSKQADESPTQERNEDVIDRPQSTWQAMKTSEDWWAVWCGAFLLAVCFLAVLFSVPSQTTDRWNAGETVSVTSPLKSWLAKPGKWESNIVESVYVGASESEPAKVTILGVLGAFVLLIAVFGVAMKLRGQQTGKFIAAFPVVFALGAFSYVLAGQSSIRAYNLEYALWALLVGVVFSNLFSIPTWLRPAIQTEFFIKTGLVLLGAEVLMSRLLAVGLPAIGVAWVVTPIVLISTYWFGQRVLKMKSRSLNMVISADMSVCGVSAAIATAASCKAKKEELSLAIGLSLSFTVVMMVLLPMVIRFLGLPTAVGGAWLGGTIDATGAVAVAGATLGEDALEVAATVKMIQNILIGVTAFCVAIYWVARVEKSSDGPSVGIGEIWHRFPKFVLGFVAASFIFSMIHGGVAGGDAMTDAMIKGSTKTLRGWLFCLAFVSIGFETRFKELWPYFRGGKPMLLYICGQSLNLILTFLMAYLMFGVLFPVAP